MFSFQKPRPEAEKRYSLLVILNDGSDCIDIIRTARL